MELAPCPLALSGSDSNAIVAGPNIPLAFVIPPGKSGLRFIGVLLLLHVHIDGAEVHPDAQGDVVVTPGLRHWEIFAPDGVTLLASGDIFCPTCNPISHQPLPPTATETPAPPENPVVLMAAVFAIFAATFVLLCVMPRRR